MSPKGGDAVVSPTQRQQEILDKLAGTLVLPIDVHAENILDSILAKSPRGGKSEAEFLRTRLLELLADQSDIQFTIDRIKVDNARILQARKSRGPNWKFENIRRVPENAINLVLKVILVKLGQLGLRDPGKIAELAAAKQHQTS